ncbi:hypothetical protein ESZ50_04900 [Weissella muntiaci]|uniref:Uncharacterized protein n=1 Tax=Weissella muntiaci TaxID=2508881 RepID=A0A6C2C7B4_9LACO|nr:hypothetical protein [Weissella muntiaci]TYC49931.1 hypothetical protein ESZ50_04900 [Weissella muntiaci]
MKLRAELPHKGKPSVGQAINSNDRIKNVNLKSAMVKVIRDIGAAEAWVYMGNQETFIPFSVDKPCAVMYTVHPPKNYRFDPQNFWPTIKPFEDGMTSAGFWTDDNSKVIPLHLSIAGEKSGTDNYVFELEIVDLKDLPELMIKHFSLIAANYSGSIVH